jgi:hypothetical protein
MSAIFPLRDGLWRTSEKKQTIYKRHSGKQSEVLWTFSVCARGTSNDIEDIVVTSDCPRFSRVSFFSSSSKSDGEINWKGEGFFDI